MRTIEGPFSPDDLLTPEECEAIALGLSDSSSSGIRNRAIVALMWRCGLRQAEVIALKPADLDYVMSTITVHGTPEANGRRVEMSVHTHHLVALWDGERRKLRKRREDDTARSFFFTIEQNKFGSALSKSYLRGMLSRAAKNAGLKKKVGAESLRDALAIELRSRGFALGAVFKFLGDRQVIGHARFRNIPEGDYTGRGFRESGWRGSPDTLDFFVQDRTATPLGPDAKELPTEVWWHRVVANSDGGTYEEPGKPELVQGSAPQGDVEIRLTRLEQKIDHLNDLVARLLKTKLEDD